ncbi:MAG: hypothetical protein PHQ27_01020 [Victivallales bacterium]|nr:hypothetical protein [Victivallales bacterium]
MWRKKILVWALIGAGLTATAAGLTASTQKSACRRGTVIAAAKIPDPRTSPYQDCDFAVLTEVDGRQLVVIMPAYRQRRLLPWSRLQPGHIISFVPVAMEKLTPAEESVQLADDLNRFDLDNVYARKVTIVAADKAASPSPAATVAAPDQTAKYLALPEGKKSLYHKPPQYEELQRQRQQLIAAEKSRIEKRLATGLSHRRELQRLYDAYNASRREKWQNNAFFANHWMRDFNAKTGMDFSYWEPNTITVIKRLNEFCRNRYIDLIVIPFPKCGYFAAKVLCPEYFPADNVVDPHYEQHLLQLLDNGIEVMDLRDAFYRDMYRYPLLYGYHCGDFHAAEGGVKIAAAAMAHRLQRYHLARDFQPGELQLQQVPLLSLRHDLAGKSDGYWPPGNPNYPVGSPLMTECVMQNGETLNLHPGNGARVLCFGDSLMHYPCEEHAANMASRLALTAGIKVASKSKSSGGITFLSRLVRYDDNILNRLRVIFLVYIPDYNYEGQKWNTGL